ncbi:MAG: hypothetical protein B5M52_06640 [Helicobacteraceae bacterium 4484_230]|nr:MAG: hypothetical protein B5M52_06640 [Helicobacteraceae bacterium 4484_230]
MRNLLLVLAMALLFLGCSSATPKPKPNEKVFEQEDMLIMFALDAELRKHFDAAAEYFNILYEKSSRKEYRDRYYTNMLRAKRYEDVEKRIKTVLKEKEDEDNDIQLRRYLVAALVGEKKLEEAKPIAIDIAAKTKESRDYVVVSDIYVRQERFDTALKYLESAYLIDYNELILDKMAVVMFVNLQRKEEAIAQLESHSRLHGCSKVICGRLVGFYSAQNDMDGLLNTYKRYYSEFHDSETAKAIIYIYSYRKDFVSLLQFLEETGENDDLLLKLYTNAKSYDKAIALADKLYKSEGDIVYLGQSAIFEFEGAKDKSDKAMLKSVISKLKKVVSEYDDALYENYLGYIMIDNGIDVKEGLIYVQRALKKEPDSPYYLDSLAWGYYKLKECKKADELMKRVVDDIGMEDEEVSKHVKAIGECLKQGASHSKE